MEGRLVALADRAHLGNSKQIALSRLDNLLPVAAIPTKEFAYTKRWIPGPTRQKLRLDPKKTPYMDAVMDATDTPGVRVVALKGPARFAKTIAAETKVLKNWYYGPLVNMIWLMQSKEDRDTYFDERVQWMLENHEEVAEKIDWSNPKNGRSRFEIGGALAQWMPATLRALRGKASPLIIADEIDAYPRKVRNAIKTLIQNRQREFGANSLAYFCSHPDAGPTEGIDDIIAMGLKHMWWWNCLDCGGASSPSADADIRMNWNVSDLLKNREDMETEALLEMIEREARLVCPHCGSKVSEDMRMTLSSGGVWLQPHQKLTPEGVEGDARIAKTMGFEGHAFMAPFAPLGELARGWAEAWIKFDNTQDDIDLKEQTVKSLGETYIGAKAEETIDPPKVVAARLGAGYPMKIVPRGVMFLTAFVDIQGDRFEVVVIGWDLMMRSWLVDRFPLKQWPGFETIDPGHKLTDYEIIELAVVNQRYQLESTIDSPEPLYLPIAKTMVNAAGQPGVVRLVREWMAHAIAAGRVQPWQVTLFTGNAHKTAEIIGRPKPLEYDEAGKAYPVQIYERSLNVHQIKRVIALRMKIEAPEKPGRMFLPFQIKPRYVKELVAEKFVNGEWVRTGDNELWDGWVACEAARDLLEPLRPGLWDTKDPATGKPILPIWATPVPREKPVLTPAAMDEVKQTSYFERLAALNRDT